MHGVVVRESQPRAAASRNKSLECLAHRSVIAGGVLRVESERVLHRTRLRLLLTFDEKFPPVGARQVGQPWRLIRGRRHRWRSQPVQCKLDSAAGDCLVVVKFGGVSLQSAEEIFEYSLIFSLP